MNFSYRSMACAIANGNMLQTPEVKEAWKTLSSLRVMPRKYLVPGKTTPIVQHISSDTLQSKTLESSQDTRKRSTLWSSSDNTHKVFQSSVENSADRLQKFSDCDGRIGGSVSYKSTTLQCRMSAGDSDRSENTPRTSGLKEPVRTPHIEDQLSVTPNYSNQNNGFVEDINDDDILKNVDVDQIVMEHFQSTCTPQPSCKLPLSFPAIKNIERPDEANLPLELSTKCNHGLKVALCPEAACHLQEMKDLLISISNELLDNDDLSPVRTEKLRQDRLELKKIVPQLETYLNSLSMDEERKRSQFSASSAASKGFQYETPSVGAYKIDPLKFDSQVHICTEPGISNKWVAPSTSPSTFDRFGGQQTSVEREAFIPKFGEVNYIEGSNDKRWSSCDFPWTNRLEVLNKKVFGNHSFRPNQREVINATMSGYDAFVLMPTGGGKSLTYQLPALICSGITLVVSPLVSLIEDQIMHLLLANIPSAYLSATLEWSDQQKIFRELTSDC
ncbi:Atp-dependent dna helicase q-like 4a, partial [Thalictrum thalictroides]